MSTPPRSVHRRARNGHDHCAVPGVEARALRVATHHIVRHELLASADRRTIADGGASTTLQRVAIDMCSLAVVRSPTRRRVDNDDRRVLGG